MANTLAYYDIATITAVKSFIVQALVLSCQLKLSRYFTIFDVVTFLKILNFGHCWILFHFILLAIKKYRSSLIPQFPSLDPTRPDHFLSRFFVPKIESRSTLTSTTYHHHLKTCLIKRSGLQIRILGNLQLRVIYKYE